MSHKTSKIAGSTLDYQWMYSGIRLPVEWSLRDERTLVFKPSTSTPGHLEIDSDQSWFWTKEWQEGESRVDGYIRQGEVETFDSMDDLLAALDGS